MHWRLAERSLRRSSSLSQPNVYFPRKFLVIPTFSPLPFIIIRHTFRHYVLVVISSFQSRRPRNALKCGSYHAPVYRQGGRDRYRNDLNDL
jgi:hypothetical protein